MYMEIRRHAQNTLIQEHGHASRCSEKSRALYLQPTAVTTASLYRTHKLSCISQYMKPATRYISTSTDNHFDPLEAKQNMMG